MKWKLVLTAAILSVCVNVVFPPEGKAQNSAKQGTLDKIKVHGKALEGNLEGDSPDRDVFVYLPASYASQSKPPLSSGVLPPWLRSARRDVLELAFSRVRRGCSRVGNDPGAAGRLHDL